MLLFGFETQNGFNLYSNMEEIDNDKIWKRKINLKPLNRDENQKECLQVGLVLTSIHVE